MRMFICAIFSLSMSAYASEITVSGDSSEASSTEFLLRSANKITIKDENGRIVAYKLGKVEKNSMLSKLGLKTGDIINMPKDQKKMLAISKRVEKVDDSSSIGTSEKK